ncbi:MAG: hypothetical protein ACTTJ3_02920 [Treponema sp.]
MGIFSFFKKQNSSPNIFINVGENKKLETKSGKIDYILTRSLYASIPTDDPSYYDFALGNYATKTYIDTLSSFISTPKIITQNNEAFNENINQFINKNKAILIKIYRQAMIDGVCYVWCRLEKDIKGKLEVVIKIVPRETVALHECIKKSNGTFEKIVFESIETWQEKEEKNEWFFSSNTKSESVEKSEPTLIEKKAKIRVTIKANTETLEVIGDMPPQYKDRKKTINTYVNFVPVFAFYNNQFSFISDGLPEIANVLPFIKKYNATFKKLETHLNQILDPKIKLHLKSVKSFLQNTLGIREKDYSSIEKGEAKADLTQFKAAILTSENEDVEFVNQTDNIKSALDVLNLIHWIIVEMTMPEYLYGTALNTTNASVKEQSPVWIKKIEDRRSEYSIFYNWLIDVYTCFSHFLHGKIEEEAPICLVEWEELETKDDLALMNALHSATDSILKALDASLISPETAFNALKTFISIPERYEREHEKAIEYIKEKNRLEAEGQQLNNAGFSSFDKE